MKERKNKKGRKKSHSSRIQSSVPAHFPKPLPKLSPQFATGYRREGVSRSMNITGLLKLGQQIFPKHPIFCLLSTIPLIGHWGSLDKGREGQGLEWHSCLELPLPWRFPPSLWESNCSTAFLYFKLFVAIWLIPPPLPCPWF